MRSTGRLLADWVTRPPPISAAEFRRRRAELIESARVQSAAHNISNGSGRRVLSLVRASSVKFSAPPDVPYPYHEASNFRYLTGLKIPDAVLVVEGVTRGQGNETATWLAVPSRSANDELWNGALPKGDELKTMAGVDEVLARERLDELIESLLRSTDAVLCYDPADFASCPSTATQLATARRPVVPLQSAIDEVRLVKSPAEQALMRHVAQVGARSLAAVIAHSAEYRNEREVAGRTLWEYARRGADGPAYPPVVAAGLRANTIHYMDSNQEIEPHTSVLMDVGCELDGYVSDISRCFPARGQRFTEPQRALLDMLVSVQTWLINRPYETGTAANLNRLFRDMVLGLAHGLDELGAFADASSLSDDGKIKIAERLCPHHVSHYLGLDVHDTPTITRNRDLPAGVVFTVEPAVYVQPNDQSLKREFRGIGLRVEDDVMTEKDGSLTVLSADCPRHAAEVEALMGL